MEEIFHDNPDLNFPAQEFEENSLEKCDAILKLISTDEEFEQKTIQEQTSSFSTAQENDEKTIQKNILSFKEEIFSALENFKTVNISCIKEFRFRSEKVPTVYDTLKNLSINLKLENFINARNELEKSIENFHPSESASIYEAIYEFNLRKIVSLDPEKDFFEISTREGTTIMIFYYSDESKEETIEKLEYMRRNFSELREKLIDNSLDKNEITIHGYEIITNPFCCDLSESFLDTNLEFSLITHLLLNI